LGTLDQAVEERREGRRQAGELGLECTAYILNITCTINSSRISSVLEKNWEADIEVFEILPRDSNLKPIFTHK